MDYKELFSYLSLLTRHKPEHFKGEVVIKAFNPTEGASWVNVKRVSNGIEGDKNKILLEPEETLTKLSAEDVENLKESAKEGQSWQMLQMVKEQAAKIKELETEISYLKKSW